MRTFEETNEFPLPTLDRLNSKVPQNLDAKCVAFEWFKSFASLIEAGDVDGIVNLFYEEAYWRDIFALTWDLRTFAGTPKIRQLLSDRLKMSGMSNLRIRDDEYLALQQPYPDLAWISFMYDYETEVGIGNGVIRLVPMSDGTWKSHVVLTNLDGLKGFPEKIGPLRNPEFNHGQWLSQRKRELAFTDADPTVLIIGAGQSGLGLGARLKHLGVSNLIVERNLRVGDNWRGRYESLCLHDPVWFDHLPYFPFPPNWPVFTPAPKLGGWLESYAEAMELNVWTSTEVTKADHDPQTGRWSVTVRQSNDGSQRVFNVKHVIFATGFTAEPNLPKYPGMDKFKGQILHSTQHKKAADHAGKKVVVVGACTSAHDICADYYRNGVDVTMMQRSSTYVMSVRRGSMHLFEGLYQEQGGPPLEIADLIWASFPNLIMSAGIAQRQVAHIAELDKDILDGLKKVGFRTNSGYKGTGFLLYAWGRAGGYYLDVGASQLIIDGKIKLKNDSLIDHFTEDSVVFDNGSELKADVVVFATGLGEPRSIVRKICGDEIGDKCCEIWGLDHEGEMKGCWRDTGIPGLWSMMGNLALCRFHSKHVALQIKAMEEGVFTSRYLS